MGWFSGGNKGGGDKPSPAHEKAKRNYDEGKSPRTTRDDLDRQRREERIKPVEPKK